MPILTLAKELNIDAAQAYLYWSTGHAVECARLNGADRMVYHPAQLFSGKQGDCFIKGYLNANLIEEIF